MQRKAYQADLSTLAEKRQVRVVVSTPEVDRAGEQVVQDGINFDSYKVNPVILWNHDPASPIARALEIGVEMGRTIALVQFPPEGISPTADEVYGLIGAEVINGASIGFNPIETEPMDPREPRGPVKYLSCELLEFSFVSIPAVRSAVVIERSAEGITTMANDRKLAALKVKARVSKSLMTKGLYEVGQLAGLLESLGWLREGAEFERELEGDGSKVPEMLGGCLGTLADALLAMTQEEVAELLAQHMPAVPLNPLPTEPALPPDARPEDIVAVTTATKPLKVFHVARVVTRAMHTQAGLSLKPRGTRERTDAEKRAALARAKQRLAAVGLR